MQKRSSNVLTALSCVRFHWISTTLPACLTLYRAPLSRVISQIPENPQRCHGNVPNRRTPFLTSLHLSTVRYLAHSSLFCLVLDSLVISRSPSSFMESYCKSPDAVMRLFTATKTLFKFSTLETGLSLFFIHCEVF